MLLLCRRTGRHPGRVLPRVCWVCVCMRVICVPLVMLRASERGKSSHPHAGMCVCVQAELQQQAAEGARRDEAARLGVQRAAHAAALAGYQKLLKLHSRQLARLRAERRRAGQVSAGPAWQGCTQTKAAVT
jgi:hypothetical protein